MIDPLCPTETNWSRIMKISEEDFKTCSGNQSSRDLSSKYQMQINDESYQQINIPCAREECWVDNPALYL